MQISELNINLLSLAKGQMLPNIGSDSETQFVDLIQSLDGCGREGDSLSVKTGDESVIKKDTEKSPVKKMSEDKKQVSDTQNTEAKSAKKTKESERKIKNNTQHQSEQKAVSEKENIVKNEENKESIEPQEQEQSWNQPQSEDITTEVDESLASVTVAQEIIVEDVVDNALSLISGVSLIPNNSENIVNDAVVEENGFENNVSEFDDEGNLLLGKQIDISENDQDGSVIFETSKIVEKVAEKLDSQPDQAIQETEIVEKDNILLKEDKTHNQVKQEATLSQQEIMPTVEKEIYIQEEKIAAKLPENKNVKINVSVQSDVVTSIPEIQRVVADVFEKEDVIAPQPQEIKGKDEIIETQLHINKQIPEKINLQNEISVAAVNVVHAEDSASMIANQEAEVLTPVNQTMSVNIAANDIFSNHIKDPQAQNVKNIDNSGLTKEVAEQIKVNITQSAVKGVDKVEIQLKPEDLGKIEIKMQIGRDGQLHAHITATNTETLEMLQKDIDLLKDAFIKAGYQADDSSFSFAGQENQDQNEREKMREFVGDIITHDVEEEMAANDYISTDGVNIRV